jgi:hypothetical protein
MTQTEPNYPRVHFEELSKHSKQEVTLVGSILGGSEIHLTKEITIKIRDLNESIPDGNFVEVRGVLLDQNIILAKGHTNFGKEFDCEVYYQAIKTRHEVLPLLTL